MLILMNDFLLIDDILNNYLVLFPKTDTPASGAGKSRFDFFN